MVTGRVGTAIDEAQLVEVYSWCHICDQSCDLAKTSRCIMAFWNISRQKVTNICVIWKAECDFSMSKSYNEYKLLVISCGSEPEGIKTRGCMNTTC